jgi:hypothetical protein
VHKRLLAALDGRWPARKVILWTDRAYGRGKIGRYGTKPKGTIGTEKFSIRHRVEHWPTAVFPDAGDKEEAG